MLAFKAIQGAGWLVISRFAGKLIDFFCLLFLARELVPADFGLAALAMSLVAVVDTVLEVPVTQALVRLRTIDKSHLDTAFTLSVIRSGVIAILVFAAAWPFSLFNDNLALIPLIGVLTIGPVVKGFYSPAMVNFSRNLGFRQSFYVEFGGKFVALFVTLGTLWLGGGYWSLAANFLTNTIVAGIMSYIFAPYRPAFSLKRFSDFAHFIGWFSSSQLVSAINWQFDRVLLGAMTDNTALGRYTVASDVASMPSQSIIGPAMIPVMSAFSRISGDLDRFKSAFLKAARFAMLIAMPTCVGISLTADLVTKLLLGDKWLSATPILSILSISMIAISYYQPLNAASVALNRPNTLFRMNAIDLMFRVVLISVGAYYMSIMGASIARLVLSFVMFSFYIYEARRVVGISITAQLRNMWKIVASVLIMSAVVLAFREYVIAHSWNYLIELAAVGTIGGLTYVVALFVLGLRLSLGRGQFEIFDYSRAAVSRRG